MGPFADHSITAAGAAVAWRAVSPGNSGLLACLTGTHNQDTHNQDRHESAPMKWLAQLLGKPAERREPVQDHILGLVARDPTAEVWVCPPHGARSFAIALVGGLAPAPPNPSVRPRASFQKRHSGHARFRRLQPVVDARWLMPLPDRPPGRGGYLPQDPIPIIRLRCPCFAIRQRIPAPTLGPVRPRAAATFCRKGRRKGGELGWLVARVIAVLIAS